VVEERDWHMGSVYTVGWNWTGGLVATGSNDQTLKVASVQRAKAEDYGNLYFGIAGPDDIGECSFEGHDGTIRDLAFSPVAENMVLSGEGHRCL
jgi:WD40 repeat protein